METNETEVQQVKRRVQARFGLTIHAATYLVINSGFVAIWALTGAHYPWFIWPLFGWGIGIVSHALAYFFGPGSPSEDRAIGRELQRRHLRAH
jgi:hypothetical protein